MGSYSIRDANIVHALDRAEKDLQDIKANQRIGKRGLATKRSVSGLILSKDNWGIGQDPTVDPPAQQIVYQTVTFKARNQTSPYGRLVYEFYALDGVTRLTDASGIRSFYYNFIVTDVDDGLLRWNVDVRGPGSPKYYMKYVVFASDEGTITSINNFDG